MLNRLKIHKLSAGNKKVKPKITTAKRGNLDTGNRSIGGNK
jgi:hypothetical protein